MINIFAVCLAVLCLEWCHQTDAQESNTFPLVAFDDYLPFIDKTAQKTYITSIELIPTTPSSVFDEAAFINSAKEYYGKGAGLDGYVNLENVLKQFNGDLLLVTYQVRYVYGDLTKDPAVNDFKIKNTIGNFDHVRSGIEKSASFIRYTSWTQVENIEQPSSFNDDVSLVSKYLTGSGSEIAGGFVFEASGENFQFTGKSLCLATDHISCNASHVTCVETLDGVSVSCTSPCKREYCDKNGICKQDSPHETPLCMCSAMYDVWYIGEHCQTKLTLWMVILVIVLMCLFIVLACLFAICCVLVKRKKTKNMNESNLFHDEPLSELNSFTYQAFNHNITDNIPQATKTTLKTTQSASKHPAHRRPSRTSFDKRDYRSRHRSHRSETTVSKAKTSSHEEMVQRHHSKKASQSKRKSRHHNRTVSTSSRVRYEESALTTVATGPSLPPRKRDGAKKIVASNNDTFEIIKPTSPIRWLAINKDAISARPEAQSRNNNAPQSNSESQVFSFHQADTMV